MPVVYYPPYTPPWYNSSLGRFTLIVGVGGAIATAYFYFTTKEPKKPALQDGRYIVPGLQNIGNTCFANSLLQALASSPAFVNWLQSLDFSHAPENKVQFLKALRDTLSGLNNSDTPNAAAGGVIEALTCHGWNIGLGREQDLYELFNVFVTTWDDELKELRRSLRHSLSHINEDEEPQPECSSQNEDEEVNGNWESDAISWPNPEDGCCCWVRSPQFDHLKCTFKNCGKDARTDAAIRPPCAGVITTQLQCCQSDCLKKKIRHDDFCVLSLAIPRSFTHIHVTLDALLRKYFSPEVIKDASCDECKARLQRSNGGLMKKQSFWKLPQSLVLRIERVGFSMDGSSYKQYDHVSFPEILDVRDYCLQHSRQAEYAREELHRRLVGGNDASGFHASSSKMEFLPNASDMVRSISHALNSRNFKYELRAVSEHLGGADSGHFVTYRKALKEENMWFRTSDSHVTRVAFPAVAASQAYLLIYEKLVPQQPAPINHLSGILLD